MTTAIAPPHAAEQIYRSGPETLIAASAAIVTGSVSGFVKQVIERSQPDGPGQMPVRWTVTGRIDRPETLKGKSPAGAVTFSRSGQSMLLPPDESKLHWETIYGDLTPEGQVVAFLGGGDPPSVLRVVPSGAAEKDLITLVKDVVAIQALESAFDREKKWLAYLNSAPADEGRKVALRSLVAEPAAWPDLEPVLGPFMRNSARSAGIRGFAFGIVAHGVTEGTWAAEHDVVVGSLCRTFAVEADPGLATQELLSLGQIVAYATQEEERQQRKALRDQVANCLQARPSLAVPGGPPVRADLEGIYSELRVSILAR